MDRKTSGIPFGSVAAQTGVQRFAGGNWFAGRIFFAPTTAATCGLQQTDRFALVANISLLQDPSASQRMRAVAYTEEITNVDLKVIDALLTTLNEDPNVNVRLATLEALTRLASDPRVREGLVHSIEHQDSPIMQSAIADVMVKLQEKRSVKSLQRLLNKKDINEGVKMSIEKSIQKLT
jgi:HEAT repeat protein